MRDDLLQPSLSAETMAAAPPSTQAMFLTSFFGGPIAAVLIVGIGSFRLRRFLRDLPILVLLMGASIGAMAWLIAAPSALHVRQWIVANAGSSSFELTNRVIALICFGIGYWLHAKAHRNSALLGLKAPNGWLVGIPCLVVGYLLMIFILSAFEPNSQEQPAAEIHT
jgi:hypothetical protein